MIFSFRKLTAVTLAVGSFVALAATGAHAQLSTLAPGGFIAPVNNSPFAGPGAPAFGATFVQSSTSLFSATNAGNTISGALYSAVYRNGAGTPGNTADDFLDFYYQIENYSVATNGLPASNANIASGSITSFINATLNVGETVTGGTELGGLFVNGGKELQSLSREDSGGGFGEGVALSYGASNAAQVQPGQRSSVLVIRTNAVAFSTGGGATVSTFAGVSANTAASVLTISAISNAPEPGTLALLGMGMVGMTGMVLRRRTK